MDFSRLGAVFVELHHPRPGAELVGTRLCLACVDVLAVDHAGILLVGTDGGSTSFGTSDATPVGIVADLQFTLGEGPGLDAHAHGHPVLEPDLCRPSSAHWSAFAAAALRHGVRGVFSFPLRTGPSRLGALDLSCTAAGALSDGQLADAVVMAEVVTQVLLAAQADARPGGLAAGFGDPRSLRLEVHQAAGMLSEQLDIRAADALVLLRAHAYAGNRPIDAVAHEVVTRVLRIDAGLDGNGG